ncbi:GNAT family N-acetyltransferase [Paractinoplanes rhizophilus]|uniref:GNAT family N-acetyltransferase n=1 Tax=Paractinoplanes rhizophilus TaxID=1416877 RepID=A0ABW2HR36_9ACTN
MLRPAAYADRDLILPWRNHPSVRAVSLTTHEIQPEEHARWWEKHWQSVLIYEDDRGTPAGVVIFDGNTWSFYLDTVGLGDRLLPAWMRLEKEAVEYAFGTLGLETLGGETLADNTQVLALHRRFGFKETRRYERLVDGETKTVVWTERGK